MPDVRLTEGQLAALAEHLTQAPARKGTALAGAVRAVKAAHGARKAIGAGEVPDMAKALLAPREGGY